MYQSSTFPTHVTMATGVTPDKHGILHNGFFDRNRGFYSYSPDASWIESEPIWSLVERQGIKTATYFWVGSESDWEGTKITYSKAPFNGRISEKDKTPKGYEKLLPAYNEAQELYRNQDWAKAVDDFKASNELEDMFPGRKTNPSQIYIPRCEHYKDNPPGDNWDGSWALTKK